MYSVLLAKHLGVKKLMSIRRYYDWHCFSGCTPLRNALKLLLKQTNTNIPDDSKIWKMFEGMDYQIPVFPYRMQMVGLWEERRY